MLIHAFLILFLPAVLNSATTPKIENRQVRCGKYEYQCENGQCIDSFQVCDGTANCRDSSDETRHLCSTDIKLECPDFSFRCGYGACVDRNKVCDGRQDCVDNSDELVPECRQQSSSDNELNETSNCKKTEFQCDSGQCIDALNICDGTPDCLDQSDETITQCVYFKCPTYGFQCDYGACIDGHKKCDGNKDCNDGSDEDDEKCDPPKPGSSSTIITTVRPPTGMTQTAFGECVLPMPPGGGVYNVAGCDTCSTSLGTKVPQLTALKFTCSEQYSLEGTNNLIYCINGSWFPAIPNCTRLCPPLRSSSVDLECFYLGKPVSCATLSKPGTKVRPKCKTSYAIVYANADFRETECLPDGTWEKKLFECQPVCGIRSYNSATTLSSYGRNTTVSEYPWHVGIFLDTDDHKECTGRCIGFICGGSLISPFAVLTAAHCVFDKNNMKFKASDMRVAVGKTSRSWLVMDETEARYSVQEFIIERYYRGRTTHYDADIAILDLTTNVVLNDNILPICIDWHPKDSSLEGLIGTVAGWGDTELGTPSDILQAVDLPFINQDACIKVMPNVFTRFITRDKFCAGYNNGTSVQKGDSGGGLAFVRKNLYYIYGIVSVKPGTYTVPAAFTDVREHLTFIEGTLTALKRRHRV